jgi:hypothetical protein
MASAATTAPGGVLERLDHVGSGWLLGASVVVLAALLAVGLGVHAAFAPPVDWHEVDASDDFEGPTSTLAERAPAHPWVEVGGWEAVDGAARITSVTAGSPNMALIDMGSTDGSVAVEGTDVADGWGMVFRYRDERNYWAVVAIPSVGGYVVREVRDGFTTIRGRLGLANTQDGVELGVRMVGTTVTIHIGGRVRLLIENAGAAPNANQAGLIADLAGVTTSRWTDFSARAAVED